MRLETLGYFENFRIVPDEQEPGEWNVIADVYFTTENIDEALKGFSYSTIEDVAGDMVSPDYRVYLPYPVYNDLEFIKELIENEDKVLVGKWIKKGLDPTLIGIIFSGVFLIIGPEWDIQYKERVRPFLKNLPKYISSLKRKGISPDLIQRIIKNSGEEVQIQFIPERGQEEDSFSEEKIFNGLSSAKEFLDSNQKTTGIRRIKLYFDSGLKTYKIFHVEYYDGTDENII